MLHERCVAGPSEALPLPDGDEVRPLWPPLIVVAPGVLDRDSVEGRGSESPATCLGILCKTYLLRSLLVIL